jgi:corrinoid protein of di/trimethylamine methyltransferase
MSQEKKEILKKLREAVSVTYDATAAKSAADEALASKVDPVEAINELSSAIRDVGNRFECGEAFLPHLVLAGEAMKAAVNILETALSSGQRLAMKASKVVFGTVKGDIHDIGKNIVIVMLKAAGFDVVDLGVDVPNSIFISEAKKEEAEFICASSLLTISMEEIADLIKDLRATGLRDKFKVMAGGGAVTENWAKSIGSDAYGRDAPEAVKAIRNLMKTT